MLYDILRFGQSVFAHDGATAFANFVAIVGIPWTLVKMYRLAALRKREVARQNEPVAIVFTDGQRAFELRVRLRRRDMLRSELQGLFGNIPTVIEKARYAVDSLYGQAFVDEIYRIRDGKGGHEVLYVACSPQELDQFRVEKGLLAPGTEAAVHRRFQQGMAALDPPSPDAG